MNPRTRLAVGWLTLFVIGTDLFIVSPLLPSIAGEFAVSTATVGLTAMVFSLSYMIAAPLFGALADRLGRVRILAACLLAFAAANMLTAAADDFVWLVLARVAAGTAAAGITPLVYAGIGEAAPPARRATWMAVAVSGLLLALSLGAPFGSLIGAACGWRTPFVMLAGASLVLAAINCLGSRHLHPAPTTPDLLPLLGGRLALRLAPTVLWATALYGMYTYLGAGLTASGFSPVQIAHSITLYGIAALVGTLIGGRAADAIGARRTMLISLVGLAVCLAVLGRNLGSELSADIVLMLASALAQLFFPAQQAALAHEFAERRASVLAWNNSALFFGISLGALIGGQVISRFGFAMTVVAGAAIAGIAVAVIAVGMRRDLALKPLLANGS